MMNKHLDPFTSYFPHLDLHGETVESATFLINMFINEHVKIKSNKVIIIHGKSSGILKKTTQDVLKASKLVNKYYIDPANDGQTIVELKQ